MNDYKKLVKALRCKGLSKECDSCDYGYHLCPDSECNDACHVARIYADAAAAIEALQADIKRLKEANDELREAQTYIDHYGDKWMTSAKDVPTSAYEHGYADGRDEAEAQLPKRGEIVRCGECKWYGIYYAKKDGTPDKRYRPSVCLRGKYAKRRDPDWFCADGERNVQE